MSGLDEEFEDETERWRAETDYRLHVSCQVRWRVIQQQNCTSPSHRSRLTLWRPLLSFMGRAIKHPVPERVKDWASKCPDVKNYKWRLDPLGHRMLWRQWASKG